MEWRNLFDQCLIGIGQINNTKESEKKKMKTWTEPGPGRKQCNGCKRYVSNGVKDCDCGKSDFKKSDRSKAKTKAIEPKGEDVRAAVKSNANGFPKTLYSANYHDVGVYHVVRETPKFWITLDGRKLNKGGSTMYTDRAEAAKEVLKRCQKDLEDCRDKMGGLEDAIAEFQNELGIECNAAAVKSKAKSKAKTEAPEVKPSQLIDLWEDNDKRVGEFVDQCGSWEVAAELFEDIRLIFQGAYKRYEATKTRWLKVLNP